MVASLSSLALLSLSAYSGLVAARPTDVEATAYNTTGPGEGSETETSMPHHYHGEGGNGTHIRTWESDDSLDLEILFQARQDVVKTEDFIQGNMAAQKAIAQHAANDLVSSETPFDFLDEVTGLRLYVTAAPTEDGTPSGSNSTGGDQKSLSYADLNALTHALLEEFVSKHDNETGKPAYEHGPYQRPNQTVDDIEGAPSPTGGSAVATGSAGAYGESPAVSTDAEDGMGLKLRAILPKRQATGGDDNGTATYHIDDSEADDGTSDDSNNGTDSAVDGSYNATSSTSTYTNDTLPPPPSHGPYGQGNGVVHTANFQIRSKSGTILGVGAFYRDENATATTTYEHHHYQGHHNGTGTGSVDDQSSSLPQASGIYSEIPPMPSGTDFASASTGNGTTGTNVVNESVDETTGEID